MLQKKGKRWDGVPVPNIKTQDLKSDTFDFFRKKAVKAQRIDEEVLSDTNDHLIENLQLKENDYIKKAAILLFHANPEKFVTGAYIKIGYFLSDENLKFQDEVHGNIFEQVEKLLTKHPSKPFNPDIANALFRSGYIESWGRGTIKMINECVQFGIPKPIYFYDMSGFWVEFKKENLNAEYLKTLGLNERQISAIEHLKDKEKMTNSDYQTIFKVSRNTASRDLTDLVDKGLLKSSSIKGAGSFYELHH